MNVKMDKIKSTVIKLSAYCILNIKTEYFACLNNKPPQLSQLERLVVQISKNFSFDI